MAPAEPCFCPRKNKFRESEALVDTKLALPFVLPFCAQPLFFIDPADASPYVDIYLIPIVYQGGNAPSWYVGAADSAYNEEYHFTSLTIDPGAGIFDKPKISNVLPAGNYHLAVRNKMGTAFVTGSKLMRRSWSWGAE